MNDNTRLALILLCGCAVVLVQMLPWLPWREIRPDLVLSVVILLGITAPLCRGAGLCWALGFLLERLSGIPPGTGQLFYLFFFLLIRLLQRFFQFQTVASAFALLCVGQVLKYGYFSFLFFVVYEYASLSEHFLMTWLFETLATLVVGPLLYAGLQRLTAETKDHLLAQYVIYHGRRLQ